MIKENIEINNEIDVEIEFTICPACDGRGYTENGKCNVCNGKGEIIEKINNEKSTI